MRISDWSSDVCSSDLGRVHLVKQFLPRINMDEREYSKTRPLPSVAAASGDAPSVSIGVDPWPKTHSARSTTTPALLMEWRVDRLRLRRTTSRRWLARRTEKPTSEIQELKRQRSDVFFLEKKKQKN